MTYLSLLVLFLVHQNFMNIIYKHLICGRYNFSRTTEAETVKLVWSSKYICQMNDSIYEVTFICLYLCLCTCLYGSVKILLFFFKTYSPVLYLLQPYLQIVCWTCESIMKQFFVGLFYVVLFLYGLCRHSYPWGLQTVP